MLQIAEWAADIFIVIRQSYGSTWVKYYNYIDPFDENKNIKVIRQVIAPGTMVRRK